MSIVVRTWKKAVDSAPFTLWDRGDELWELKGDILRHFSVIDRSFDANIVTEKLKLLKDSPIPLEALHQEIQGWEVTESLSSPPGSQPRHHARQIDHEPLPPKKKPLPPHGASPFLKQGPAFLPDNHEDVLQSSLPHQSSHESPNYTADKEKNKSSTSASSVKEEQHMVDVAFHSPCSAKSYHEMPLPLIPNLLEEQLLQHSYTLPAELWSSLSQWIPPSALFQPSLHHQAFLELSRTQAYTYPSQKDLDTNSQPSQGQHQYVKQVQQTKPYSPKPSSHKIRSSSGPLFV